MANLAEQPELVEAMAAEYEHNCHTVAAAAEDLQHHNMARLTLLREHQGVAVDPLVVQELKLDVMVEFLCAQDELLGHRMNFALQQKVAALLNDLEVQHSEEGDHNDA